jgi:hypothetical protein
VNGATAAKLEFVIGLSEQPVLADVTVYSTDAGPNQRSVAIGLDSITVPNGISANGRIGYAAVSGAQAIGDYEGYPGVGYHYAAWLEAGNGTSVTTWYGDNGVPTFMQNGLRAKVWA